MMTPFFLAQATDGFLSFLLYLFIAVVWVVGKILQQRQARQKVAELKKRREEREREAQRTGRPSGASTPPPPPPSPQPKPKPRTLEDELQEFLGRMAGMEPEPTPPPPPPPPAPKRQPQLQFDQAPPPPPPRAPSQRRAPRPSSRAEIQLDEMAEYAKIQDIEDIAELELDPDKASFAGPDLLLNVRAMMIDMSRANVRIPTVRIPTMRTVHTQTAKPDLNNSEALKHAIVSGILLNPPKALTPDPFHQDPGQL